MQIGKKWSISSSVKVVLDEGHCEGHLLLFSFKRLNLWFGYNQNRLRNCLLSKTGQRSILLKVTFYTQNFSDRNNDWYNKAHSLIEKPHLVIIAKNAIANFAGFLTVWVSHLTSVQLINTPFHGTVLEQTLIIHTSLISSGLLKSVKVILNNGNLQWVKPIRHFLKMSLSISTPDHVRGFYLNSVKIP